MARLRDCDYIAAVGMGAIVSKQHESGSPVLILALMLLLLHLQQNTTAPNAPLLL
jgi:hypothetical protein